MKNTVYYEWVLETLDYYEGCGDDPDIIDVHHWNTYDECVEFSKKLENTPFRIGLTRNVGNPIEGLIDRSWAYIKDDKLPIFFNYGGDGMELGVVVPKQFHKWLQEATQRG